MLIKIIFLFTLYLSDDVCTVWNWHQHNYWMWEYKSKFNILWVCGYKKGYFGLRNPSEVALVSDDASFKQCQRSCAAIGYIPQIPFLITYTWFMIFFNYSNHYLSIFWIKQKQLKWLGGILASLHHYTVCSRFFSKHFFTFFRKSWYSELSSSPVELVESQHIFFLRRWAFFTERQFSTFKFRFFSKK